MKSWEEDENCEINRGLTGKLSFLLLPARFKIASLPSGHGRLFRGTHYETCLCGSSEVRRPGLRWFFPKVAQRVRSLIAWALKLWPKLLVLWLLYLTGLRILQKDRARLVHHKRDVALTTKGMWLKTPERSDLIYRRTWVRSSTAVCHEKFGEMHHCNKDICAVVQWLMYF